MTKVLNLSSDLKLKDSVIATISIIEFGSRVYSTRRRKRNTKLYIEVANT